MAERFEVGRRDLRQPLGGETDVFTVHDRARSRFAVVVDRTAAQRIVQRLKGDPEADVIYVWRDCVTEEKLPRLVHAGPERSDASS